MGFRRDCDTAHLAREGAMHLPAADDVRAGFAQRGVLVVSDFLSPADADAMAACATRVASRHGIPIRRTVEGATLDYRVVTGDIIRSEAASIHEMYESADLLGWIRKVVATPDVGLSPHIRSAVNVNVLQTAGQQYRWHTDAVPFTVLVFLTTLPADSGGEFLIRTRMGELMTIPARAGQLVLMDGRQCAHAVAPLRDDILRITVPMVFPAYQIERPQGLDDYLYSSQQ